MIRTIIVLMSIAMIGLVGFQTYWINNAIDVNNVKFRQNVHDALNIVVTNLEKKEVYSAASKQINNRPFNQRFFQIDTNLLWANKRRPDNVKDHYSTKINQQAPNSFDWEYALKTASTTHGCSSASCFFIATACMIGNILVFEKYARSVVR